MLLHGQKKIRYPARPISMQHGFTLVELAIVMAIIGILIGGTLKGRQIMDNARVAATIAQINAVESAVTTFRDTYDQLPGDMFNASARIPGCTLLCDPEPAGASDGLIGGANSAVLTSAITSTNPLPGGPDNETTLFWVHLLKADLIGGITDSAISNGTYADWGETHLAARIGGGFFIGHLGGNPLIVTAGGGGPGGGPPGGAPPGLGPGGPGGGGAGCPGGGAGPGAGAGCGIGGGGGGGGGGGTESIIPGRPVEAAGTLPAGMVLVLRRSVDGAIVADTGLQPLTARRAAQFDRKMDDGHPDSGRVQAYGTTDSCYFDPDGNGEHFSYAEFSNSTDCGLFFKIQ
ncbi:MAG: type II secretion system protein [Micavibrio sp.]|nr:MAG: type II secretion system protein [Micavibrio sp.]